MGEYFQPSIPPPLPDEEEEDEVSLREGCWLWESAGLEGEEVLGYCWEISELPAPRTEKTNMPGRMLRLLPIFWMSFRG